MLNVFYAEVRYAERRCTGRRGVVTVHVVEGESIVVPLLTKRDLGTNVVKLFTAVIYKCSQ